MWCTAFRKEAAKPGMVTDNFISHIDSVSDTRRVRTEQGV